MTKPSTKTISPVDRYLASPLATWFGCGSAPIAPGTVASLGALVPAFLLVRYAGFKPWHFALLAAVATPPAIWAAGSKERQLGKTDPHQVVIDEVVGQWLTLAGATALNWKSWLAAFFLFRALDIWKPAPVRQSQALPGGVGIVVDDVLAAVYAALVLWAAGCFNLY